MRNIASFRRVFGTDQHPHPLILGQLFQAEQGTSGGHTGYRGASRGPQGLKITRPERGNISADAHDPCG